MLSHLVGNFPDIDIHRAVENTAAASDTADIAAVAFGKIAQLMHKSLSQSFLFARPWIVS
jgi:hypothetical protein